MDSPPPDPTQWDPFWVGTNFMVQTSAPDVVESKPKTYTELQYAILQSAVSPEIEWPVVLPPVYTYSLPAYQAVLSSFNTAGLPSFQVVEPAPSPTDVAKTALAAFVRLDDGGLGTGDLYRDQRGRVWQTAVAGTTLARLGNVRDLKNGGYGASYCGEEYGVGRTVLKQRYATVDDATLAVGLNHDLRVVLYAAELLFTDQARQALRDALEAMRAGNSLTLLARLATVVGWLDEYETFGAYVRALHAAAKRLHSLSNWSELVSAPMPSAPEVSTLNLAPYRARQQALRAALASGSIAEAAPEVIGKAKASSVAMVAFQDGTRAVRKAASPEAMDHEMVAALVAYAFDPEGTHLAAPAVVRLDETTVLMEVVPGVASKHFEYGDGCPCCAITRLVDGEPKAQAAAVMMTSLDLVLANSDRHCDNLLLGEDFRFGLIDHAYSLDLDKFHDADCLSLHGWRRHVTHAQVNRWEAGVRSIAGAVNAELVARQGVDLASQVLARLEKLRELATV